MAALRKLGGKDADICHEEEEIQVLYKLKIRFMTVFIVQCQRGEAF